TFSAALAPSIPRIMLPISFVAAIAFVGLGVPATFEGAATATTLNGAIATPAPVPGATAAPLASLSPVAAGQQTIARGVVAPLISIKHLGTNGGGWFNANSAHPFENPTPITNVLETILLGLISKSIFIVPRIMLNRRRQAWTFFGVMGGFFLVFLVLAYVGEANGNPLLNAVGLNP